MPRIPPELWARFTRHGKPDILLVTVHLADGRYVDEVIVNGEGEVAGVRVDGHIGVDPGPIDFTTDQIDAIATRQGVLATFGIRRWHWR